MDLSIADGGQSMGQTGRQMRARTKKAITSRQRAERMSVPSHRSAWVRYTFDRSMSRGTGALVAWLALATVLLTMLFALTTSVLDLRQGQSDGFFHELFQSLLHALDPGTVAGDDGTWPYLLTMLVLTLAGLIIVSALIGVIAAGIDAKLADLRRGRSRVIESGHVVILGWSDAVFTILEELAIANENLRRSVVVILAERDKVVMEDEIRNKVPGLRGTRVVCRTGSPIDLGDLALCSATTARSIVVLSSAGPDSDSEVIKVLLALTHNNEYGAPIVAEIADPENLETARMVGRGRAVLVDRRGSVARLIVQTSRQSGAAAVYTELFDFHGDEIYFHADHGLRHRQYGDVLGVHEDASVLGLLAADGAAHLNPPHDTPIGDSALIMLAEDDSALESLSASTAALDEQQIPPTKARVESPVKALMLGWNERAYTVVRELDQYVEPGSTLTVLTEFGEPNLPELSNLKATVDWGRTATRHVLNRYVDEDLDHVIVLCYSDDLGIQQADARTLVTLLHVRDIVGEFETPVVVSELLDDRNRPLAEVAHVDDVIVSDRILSLMLAQLCTDRRLESVFSDLLDADGAEIYLRPAEWYVATGEEVNFKTIIEAARRRGETAFGYRSTALIGSANLPSGVVLNPAKSDSFAVSAGDRVVVLAAD